MRKYLCRTTAIMLAVGGLAIGAHAQETTQTAAASFCDTPWMAVDGNDDGFVSKAEATGATEKRFGEIDADSNGEITKTEYVDCMTRSSGQTAAGVERDDESFKQADANKDDKVDRNEFRDQASKAFEDSRTASAEDPDAWVVLQRYVWLTPEEFSDDAKLSDMSADEAAGRSAMTFSALDENSDGILDTEEWSEKEPSSRMDEEWASARFDEFDANASGAIDSEEYRSARSNMLDETTTGSTAQDGSAKAESSSDAASNDTASADEGVPVYVYRFLTF